MKKVYSFSFVLCCFLFCGFAFSQSGSQEFTSSGTFSVPAGVTLVTIEVVGAGGSGGSNGGGGGGGGGYARGTYNVTPLATLTVTVGTPGSGSVNGTTSVDALIMASGGVNGGTVPNPNIGGGGTGGSGSGGIANSSGGSGGGGYYTYFGGGGGGAAGATGIGTIGGNTIVWIPGNCITPGGSFGPGGGAPGGNGGKGAGFTDLNCNVTDPAGNGDNYGGGGGGGNGNGGARGIGAGGYCKISWEMYVGENETPSLPDLQVNPNPVTDKILVHNASGTEIYELINIEGLVIWAGSDIEQQDFSKLASGLYLLKVIRQNSVRTLKIVK